MPHKNKETYNEYMQQWRKRNKQRVAEANKRRYIRGKDFVDKAKSVPCADCGVQYPPHVMQFDHLPEFDKRFTIASQLYHSIELLLEEIAKCEVVCANCHAERTHQRKSM